MNRSYAAQVGPLIPPGYSHAVAHAQRDRGERVRVQAPCPCSSAGSRAARLHRGSNPAARHASPIALRPSSTSFRPWNQATRVYRRARPGGSSFRHARGFDREPGSTSADPPHCATVRTVIFRRGAGGRCERDRVPPDRGQYPGTRRIGAGEVPVRVDVDQPVLVGRPAFPANRVERRGRQRHQRGPLLVEHLGHGHVQQPRAIRVPGEPVAPLQQETASPNCPYDSARMGGTMRLRRKT